ncbi:AMP-binding protein [Mycobacterium intracellulare]|uniref:class I adenylate-forming enzyme family protein n=1 Tax=Mycobacterium intracellulare TaxID=1767 RepID=UPI001CDA6F03|nr:AMP-binding protein [Mycobacterium intracellulare]MCA2255999.1 AMP-binding protein [Mycobacterium intracellulare]
MNIAELVSKAARRWPERTAWIFGDRRANYSELVRRAAAVAAALADRGVGPGDRVVIDLPNSPELIEMLLGCFWGGFVAVPLNWHLRPSEVRYIVDHCQARAVLTGEPSTVGAEDGWCGSALVIDGLAYAEITADERQRGGIAEVRPEDAAWLFYTSGTTGRPKGAMLTHRNLLAMTLSYFADVDAVTDGAAVFLHAAPLSHGSGLYLLPALARAATQVVLDAPRFTAGAYFEAVQRHSVTHGAFLAPTMLKRLVDAGNPAAFTLSSLRSIVVGGAPLYAGDLRDAHRLFGPIITQIYGQGEAPMTITVMRSDDSGASTRPRSTGRSFTGVEVRCVDGTGRPAPAGVAGEVCVRSDVVMSGYWDDTDATAAALRDGWLRSGDVGYLDDAGYLFLTDRIKDVIISGGSNIYPREVEEALIGHPAVAEAAVIGLPDREWGESVCAMVVPCNGAALSDDELRTHCSIHLASFKRPRQFVIVDSLPKNAAGKVLKRELRELATARASVGAELIQRGSPP